MTKVNYIDLYDQMEFNKAYTAKDLGVTSSSMTAMFNRGLVEKFATKPMTYKKKVNNTTKVLDILKENLTEPSDYFVVHRRGEKLAMMCSLKNGTVLDCYGKIYSVADADSVKVFKPVREFSL